MHNITVKHDRIEKKVYTFAGGPLLASCPRKTCGSSRTGVVDKMEKDAGATNGHSTDSCR